MSHVTRLRTLLLLLSVAVSLSGLGQRASLGAGQNPSPDEASLRTAVSQYFELFAKKDSDALLKCWSAGAPDLEARKKEWQQEFAANDHIEVRNLTILRLAIDGDKATVRVAVEITASEGKVGQPAAAFGKMVRAMQCVKEAGVWKIARETSAAEELAASVAG